MDQKKLEEFLGPRGEHYHGGHGDAGCFSACPVWEWDQRSRSLQTAILDMKIDLLEWALAGATETGEDLFSKAIDEAKSQRAKLEK